MVETKFARMFPNPENIQKYLGKTTLKAKIKKITFQENEIVIETDVAPTATEVSVLEEFFKYGLHSVWKVAESNRKGSKT
jgi:hypothetical protein